jgi:hypothetical protein
MVSDERKQEDALGSQGIDQLCFVRPGERSLVDRADDMGVVRLSPANVDR